MLMTKEQAGNAWCPMVRLVAADEGRKVAAGAATLNRVQADDATLIPPATLCMVDRCAMWRWDGKVKMPIERTQKTWWPKEDYAKVEPERPPEVPDYAVWLPLTGEGDDIDGGYWVEPQARVDAEYAAAKAEAESHMRGYCGLAGKPA